MKIGILETGEVHPDLKPRHGDYPAMQARTKAFSGSIQGRPS